MTRLMSWPTRVPGMPYRWVLSLATEEPASHCGTHRVTTDGLGVCAACVSEWRRSMGADPDEWSVCTVCGLPLHPAVEADGGDCCPSCDGARVVRVPGWGGAPEGARR